MSGPAVARSCCSRLRRRTGLAADVDVEARLAGSLAEDWRARGLCLAEARPATPQELAATKTTWARRLDLGRAGDRAAWRLVLRR